MEIVTDFTIPSPPDEAYRFLLEVDRVAPCVPGGELGPRCADGSYPAKVTVRLGPMRLVYAGSLSIAEQDGSERRAVLRATALESAGQGTVYATMTMRVTPNAVTAPSARQPANAATTASGPGSGTLAMFTLASWNVRNATMMPVALATLATLRSISAHRIT